MGAASLWPGVETVPGISDLTCQRLVKSMEFQTTTAFNHDAGTRKSWRLRIMRCGRIGE